MPAGQSRNGSTSRSNDLTYRTVIKSRRRCIPKQFLFSPFVPIKSDHKDDEYLLPFGKSYTLNMADYSPKPHSPFQQRPALRALGLASSPASQFASCITEQFLNHKLVESIMLIRPIPDGTSAESNKPSRSPAGYAAPARGFTQPGLLPGSSCNMRPFEKPPRFLSEIVDCCSRHQSAELIAGRVGKSREESRAPLQQYHGLPTTSKKPPRS